MSLHNDRNFYRRPLPAPSVAFSSPEGRVKLMEAMQSGTAECYWGLAEQFTTQAEVTYCGLASLVMALNALSIDPGRIWKGVWRWYSEEMLDCCMDLETVKKSGINFGQFKCLATCNGAQIQSWRGHETDIDTFRRAVKATCSFSKIMSIMVCSYSRKALNQTGDGHFSPIAAYHEPSDCVLIMDVARFKYPPHWAPLTSVFQAMQLVDGSTGLSRGFYVLQPDHLRMSVFIKLGIGFDQDEMINKVKTLLQSETYPTSLGGWMTKFQETDVASMFFPRCCSRCCCRKENRADLDEEYMKSVQELASQIESTGLFERLSRYWDLQVSTECKGYWKRLDGIAVSSALGCKHLFCLFMWAFGGMCPISSCDLCEIESLPEYPLRNEIQFIQRQIKTLIDN